MALIELKNITKYYGVGTEKVKALDNVSISISKGEFVAVAGSSGSGKSTLMNMLGCLDVQSEGEYLLDGVSVKDMSENKLSHIRNKEIGFIFQSFNLIPNLTAAENVELPLMYRGVPKNIRREITRKALEKVSLKHRMNHRPSEMSGGQQQRVAIARALASSPPIILADEPTGNLDSRMGKEIMDLLLGLNMDGTTVVMVTHDARLASEAKTCITMNDGEITDLS